MERQSSVLKELMENSLDAGARRLDIEVEEGGIKLIRVRDVGFGFLCVVLALVLCCLASCLFRVFVVLVVVWCLGFRGEALPSNASV